MPTPPDRPGVPRPTENEGPLLAAAILRLHRSLVRELRIEVVGGGVVLRGRAATFYGKQLALHEVLRRGLAVVANDIVVAPARFDETMA
jgi:hypothetical protein